LRVTAPIGVHALERKAKCVLEISVQLSWETSTPIREDLSQSVDYADVVSLIRSVLHQEFALLESLGETILDNIAARFPLVEEAQITLVKPHILISGAQLESSSVCLTRNFRH